MKSIETKGFDQTGGLVDFVRHITYCIDLANEDSSNDISVLIAKNNFNFKIKKWISPFKGFASSLLKDKKLSWVKYQGFDQKYLEKVFDNLSNVKNISPGYSLNSHLSYIQKCNFDIIFPCLDQPPSNFKLPWIGYFWDFQHKYYPEFFNRKEIERRNIFSNNMFNNANNVIVNSNAVKKDADKFVSNHKSKVHVVPFSPGAKLEWITDNRDVGSYYGIKKPYFIICNHFYIHKNHQTAFKAFAKFLSLEGKNFQLVCTGLQNDGRDIKYFSKLLTLLKKLDLEKDVIFTGHIPKLDQISLLKRSLAVIQPTLFEGGPGGGSSYDAISLGHRLIISDISVNCEIEKNSNVNFFNTLSVDDLTNKLLKIINTNFLRDNNNVLLESSRKRMINCGMKLLSIAEEVVNKR